MLRSSLILLSIVYLSLATLVTAAEKIPDDVRYMLEDMYGANKSEWPSPRYQQDLNNDGFPDWVATKKNCLLKEKCPAELFICIPNKKGTCSEYCYIEVKTLKNIEESLKTLKCESTC